ncbi:uncharacterized protein K441DRAFT_664410 [Cenococcum geophilum 1.58]|uniref:uncharacterized protein n=1 Tax=Cenococcum geophilum 1.58 TaxID=794803 RepID=UPI00358E4382|nr:hypothetical protein K441DRAFT_664410 [Cenococcum geophilum 1.58]
MADGTRLEIIKANPIGKGLNAFRNSFESTCRSLAISGPDALYNIKGEGMVHCELANIPNTCRNQKLPP